MTLSISVLALAVASAAPMSGGASGPLDGSFQPAGYSVIGSGNNSTPPPTPPRDIEISPKHQHQQSLPGDNVTYHFYVANHGRRTVDLTLETTASSNTSFAPQTNWTHSLSPRSLRIAAGGSVEVVLGVQVPLVPLAQEGWFVMVSYTVAISVVDAGGAVRDTAYATTGYII
ncbi:MAG TPA: hypothetical protein VJB14_01140 [Planctomycetota bacterium]|nr:hypothetical protein [Planctomycetota bacterium]